MQERWLADFNVSLLFDGDNSTCLDLTEVTTILTLQQQTPQRSVVLVKVVLPDNLESNRHNIVRVLTSEVSGTSCPNTLHFKKCEVFEGQTYVCICSSYCLLSVKITFLSEWLYVNHRHEVCEIEMLK